MGETEIQCVGADHMATMEIERARIEGGTAAIWLRCPVCGRAVAVFTSIEVYRTLEPTLKFSNSIDMCVNV